MFLGGEVGPRFPGGAISAFVLGLQGGVGTGCRVLGGSRLQAQEHCKRPSAAHNAFPCGAQCCVQCD